MSKPRHKTSLQPGADKIVSSEASRRSRPPRSSSRAAKNLKGEKFLENRTLDLTQKISQRKVTARKVAVRKAPSKPRKKSAKAAKPRSLAEKLKFFGMCAAFGAVSIALLTYTALSYKDYGLFQSQVEAKEVRLQALQTQLATGEKRLQALQHPKGREQLLIERGYVKPGERLLLFPETAKEKRQAIFATNDLTPHLPQSLVENGESETSAWRRVAKTLSGWWGNLRRASDTPTPLPIPPLEEKTAPKSEDAAKTSAEVSIEVSTQRTSEKPATDESAKSSFSVEN